MPNELEEIFELPREVEHACEFYSTSEEIKFPIINPKNGITINRLEYGCKRCNSMLEKYRGIMNFYDAYTELKMIAICPGCQIFAILPKHRIYPDGRILAISQNGTQTHQANSNKSNKWNIIFYIILFVLFGLMTYFGLRR